MWKPPVAQPWVIRETIRFNSAAYTFEPGDIEVTGSRISAILPAGTSRLVEGVDGSSFVCTPGVVDVERPDGSPAERGLRAGGSPSYVTTVGFYCSNIESVTSHASFGPVRRVALLRFNGRYLEQVNAMLDWSAAAQRTAADTCAARLTSLLPVIASGTLLSATEVVEFARFAKTMGSRFGIELSSSADEAFEFRGRFYCSESALIAYLMPQEPNITVFNAGRLDRRDVAALLRTRSAVSIDFPRKHDVRGSTWTCSLLFGNRQAAIRIRQGDMRALLLDLLDGVATDTLNGFVSALTKSAAAALGLTDVGALAPGMKADLCLFDRSDFDASVNGSAAFLSMLAKNEPAYVMVDGQVVLRGTHTDALDDIRLGAGEVV
ncbi:amidohydrolase family protein [Caballeronia sp. SEWSISQ10-4 2]|uniref:amidohydrolase family protein n=1 Tax=Caballeronia sp. SEWSISQ10-4 2 TaxID=2937438 RepID=UPI00264D1DD5|nr:amidohydrolase family protein [Caballeronia sp. SEWSISQ10-4 2]MDN7177156.1 amidohydrolase family protein [Caballeronia sp. SEWSISQ10-4 2]